jgi:hypothetical protein
MGRRQNLATFEEAKDEIRKILEDGEWHTSTGEIHEPLEDRMSGPMFGRVKKALRIEHRRVGGGVGSYYEWRLPRRARSSRGA